MKLLNKKSVVNPPLLSQQSNQPSSSAPPSSSVVEYEQFHGDLMSSLKALEESIARSISTKNVETLRILESGLRKLYDVIRMEDVDGKDKIFDQLENQAKQTIQNLGAKISNIDQRKPATNALMPLLPLTISFASSCVQLGYAAQGLEEDNNQNSQASVATSTITMVALLSTIILTVRDYQNGKKRFKVDEKQDEDDLSVCINDVKNLIREIHFYEIASLRNTLEAKHKGVKLERQTYWLDYYKRYIQSYDPRNPARYFNGQKREETLALLCSRVAIISSTDIKKDEAKEIKALKEVKEDFERMFSIKFGDNFETEELQHLREIDLALPTIYAQILYQYGRKITELRGTLQLERDYMIKCLQRAKYIREQIDLVCYDPYSQRKGTYDERFNQGKIKDTLLFERSGLLEYELQTMVREINDKRSDQNWLQAQKGKLEGYIRQYNSLIERGSASGDSSHTRACNEKQILVYAQLAKISTSAKEIGDYFSEAYRISPFARWPIESLSTERLENLLIEYKEMDRTIFRSANEIIGILIEQYRRSSDVQEKGRINNNIIKLSTLFEWVMDPDKPAQRLCERDEYKSVRERYQKNKDELSRLAQPPTPIPASPNATQQAIQQRGN
jgi:hypothetical protein